MQNTIAATMTRTLLRRHAPYAATATLAALLGLSSVIAQAIPTAHASALSVRYTRGYSVQGDWLCYGWSNGAYHCTQHWRGSSGHYVSLNPSWVPSEGSATTSGVAHTQAGTTVLAAINPRTSGYAWGQCTYGAALLAHDNVSGLGNAYQWAYNARVRGLPTGYVPRVGATVVFQRGVDGASWSYGHVAHVVAVANNGSFEIEAMNDVAGFGRFGFRWVSMAWGVSFIY